MAHQILKCKKCGAILENGLWIPKHGNRKKCGLCGGSVTRVLPSSEDIILHVEAVKKKCGNMSYDSQLKEKCDLFDLHEFSLPYVPENYGRDNRPKILHIGESNYIDGQKYHGALLRDLFVNDWWEKKLDITDLFRTYPEMDWQGDYTRYVLDSFKKGYSNYFSNYSLVGKTYFNLKGEENPIQCQIREWVYNNIAETDFYKIPSPNPGTFINKVKSQMKIEKFNKAEQDAFMGSIIQQSVNALNTVIEVLNPDYVIFASKDGYTKYTDKNINKDFDRLFSIESERKLISLCHPTYLNRWKKKDPEKWNELIEPLNTILREAFDLM